MRVARIAQALHRIRASSTEKSSRELNRLGAIAQQSIGSAARCRRRRQNSWRFSGAASTGMDGSFSYRQTSCAAASGRRSPNSGGPWISPASWPRRCPPGSAASRGSGRRRGRTCLNRSSRLGPARRSRSGTSGTCSHGCCTRRSCTPDGFTTCGTRSPVSCSRPARRSPTCRSAVRARRRGDHAQAVRALPAGPLAQGCGPARHATICNHGATGRTRACVGAVRA